MDIDRSQQKVAIITGAAGSIGGEIAERLDRRGFRLVLVDINSEGLEEVRARLAGTHESCCTDIRRLENVRRIVAGAMEKHGRIDGLINNAGTIVTEPFDRCPHEEMERELDVNYRAALYFIREVVPVMKARGKGWIVSVCSLGGILPLAECPGYSGSKYALRGLMLSLHLTLKPYGIRVTNICSTSIETPMLHHEALDGGSPLNFLSEPLPPARVADAVLKAIKSGKVEICVTESEGFASKLAVFFPSVASRVFPLLALYGERNRKKYVKRFR